MIYLPSPRILYRPISAGRGTVEIDAVRVFTTTAIPEHNPDGGDDGWFRKESTLFREFKTTNALSSSRLRTHPAETNRRRGQTGADLFFAAISISFRPRIPPGLIACSEQKTSPADGFRQQTARFLLLQWVRV